MWLPLLALAALAAAAPVQPTTETILTTESPYMNKVPKDYAHYIPSGQFGGGKAKRAAFWEKFIPTPPGGKTSGGTGSPSSKNPPGFDWGKFVPEGVKDFIPSLKSTAGPSTADEGSTARTDAATATGTNQAGGSTEVPVQPSVTAKANDVAAAMAGGFNWHTFVPPSDAGQNKLVTQAS